MITDFAIQVAAAVVGGLLLLWATLWIGRKRPLRRPHNIRTGRLGLQFVQDGRFAPIFHRPDTDEVLLQPAPFEIRVPHAAWSAKALDRKLRCAVFPTDRIWKAFEAGFRKENEFFPGMAFVDHEHGSGRLALSRFPWEEEPKAFSYNFISGSRFNASGDEYLGIYVSAITSKPLASLETSGSKAKGVIQGSDAANEIRKGVKLYLLISVEDGTSADAHEKLVCVFK
jgi:hypothetical protein